MKLYLPSTPLGNMASCWTGQVTEPVTMAAGTLHLDYLSAGKAIPFYDLRTSPIIGQSTVTFTGHHHLEGGVNDFTPNQVATFGVPLSGGGTVPYAWAFNPSAFAYSGLRDLDQFVGGIKALSFIPMYVFIYRPSTGAVIGYLAKWGKLAFSFASIDNVFATALTSAAGGTQSFTNWKALLSEVTRDQHYTVADVAALSGDFICFEFWAVGQTQTANVGIRDWAITLDMGWGAGPVSTDQPSGSNTSIRGSNTFLYFDDLKNTTAVVGVPYSPGAINLTNVSPGTGPRLSLTFDGPVGISGPTIAGPMDGLGVTGATQILPVQIDLACVIRPDHPDGDADNATLVPPIGEADPIGPPIPTGVGAVTI